MADVLCPVVIGRSVELEALRRALDAARDSAGSVAFLLGEAGIGKSRLARELIVAARGAGMVVLRGRAVPGAQNVALRPLAEALGSHVEALTSGNPELDPWLPALCGMVPGVDAPKVDSSSAVRGEALVRALGLLSRRRGGLLVLEDLHWADPDTLAVVERDPVAGDADDRRFGVCRGLHWGAITCGRERVLASAFHARAEAPEGEIVEAGSRVSAYAARRWRRWGATFPEPLLL